MKNDRNIMQHKTADYNEIRFLAVHLGMIEMMGGADRVREKSLLDSALNAPFQTFGGRNLYLVHLSKTAVMCQSIISNHPFVDGNKRTGIHVMLIFLEFNGIKLQLYACRYLNPRDSDNDR